MRKTCRARRVVFRNNIVLVIGAAFLIFGGLIFGVARLDETANSNMAYLMLIFPLIGLYVIFGIRAVSEARVDSLEATLKLQRRRWWQGSGPEQVIRLAEIQGVDVVTTAGAGRDPSTHSAVVVLWSGETVPLFEHSTSGSGAFRRAEQFRSLLRGHIDDDPSGRRMETAALPKEVSPESTDSPRKPNFRWSRGYFALLALYCWFMGLGGLVEALDPSMTTDGIGVIWSKWALWFFIGFAILSTYVAVWGRYLKGRDIGRDAGFVSPIVLMLALATIVVFSSTPFRTSKAWVASSEGVAEMLGEIERVYPSMFFSYSIRGDKGRASFGFMTHGKRASGRVAVRFDRSHGEWRMREATLNGKLLDTNDGPP